MQTALVEAARARIPNPHLDDDIRSAIQAGELPELEIALCEHRVVAFGFRTASNGVKHLYVYCQACRRYGGPLPKEVYGPEAPGDAPAVSNSLPFGIIRAWRERAWRRKYDTYMASPEWQEMRRRILLRDDHVCQMQLHGCTGRAVHVHHVTYERLGLEWDEDLLSVCRECHERHHGHSVSGSAVRA